MREAADQQGDDPGVLADVQDVDSWGVDIPAPSRCPSSADPAPNADNPATPMTRRHDVAFNGTANQCLTGGDAPSSATMARPSLVATADRSKPPAVDTPLQKTTKQSRSNRQRKRKREARIVEEGYAITSYAIKRHIKPAEAVETGLKVADLPATSCGYAALNEQRGTRLVLPTVAEELRAKGYELIPNDGM